VDDANNVYVLNCHYDNSDDTLWVYRPDGQWAARRELQDLGIRAPVGLCVSRHDPSRLYLASSENRPDADSVRLYVLATEDLSPRPRPTIEIYNMGHITDIAEDPISGDVCIVGFQITRIPPDSQFQGITLMSQPPFYEPRIAILHFDDPGPVEATYPIEAAITRGMALPLSVVCAEGE